MLKISPIWCIHALSSQKNWQVKPYFISFSSPATMDDLLFHCLSPMELHRYSQTSKTAYQAVIYNWCAFKLEYILGAYFTSAQTLEFHRLQCETGMFISGSAALQFFDHTVYPGSNLDLYVKMWFHVPIAHWLEKIGYDYVPPAGLTAPSRVSTLAQALTVNAPSDEHFLNIAFIRARSRNILGHLSFIISKNLNQATGFSWWSQTCPQWRWSWTSIPVSLLASIHWKKSDFSCV